jgi:thioesterase domain-containing protein
LSVPQNQVRNHSKSKVTHAVLIRGFQDWYSTGIDALANELRAAGVDARVYAQADGKLAGDALLADAPRPLVLIGFSYGADDAVRISRRLKKANKPVDLLITIDPSSRRRCRRTSFVA